MGNNHHISLLFYEKVLSDYLLNINLKTKLPDRITKGTRKYSVLKEVHVLWNCRVTQHHCHHRLCGGWWWGGVGEHFHLGQPLRTANGTNGELGLRCDHPICGKGSP